MTVFLIIVIYHVWRRKWQPIPALLPGKSHGWRSLGGCSPWGHKESDTTEWLHFHFHHIWIGRNCHICFSKAVAQVHSDNFHNCAKESEIFLCGRVQFGSVQSLSRVWLFMTPWIAARKASLSITNSRSLPKLMSIESVMPSSHIILCHPLLLLPPTPPSIRVFSNKSTLRMRWPKCWSFSFSISPSSEHPGLIFRMDWLDLLAVQGTLKTLLQHHSSKASILWHSDFFAVQLSHPYMTTGKP